MPSFERKFGYLLAQTYRQVSMELSARIRPYDITREQWAVLSRLIDENGITQVELAERCDKDQPTVTRIIQHLVRKGFIQRMQSARDKRAYEIRLTAAGEALIEQLIPIEQAFIAELMAGFSSAEEERLVQDMLHVQRNVRSTDQQNRA
ncbi:MarR family transcriptional regulator [Paenibacillus sp. ACRRX]|nr:MarR family transcriptional regulator [Paenibacillus sp. ACRRX]